MPQDVVLSKWQHFFCLTKFSKAQLYCFGIAILAVQEGSKLWRDFSSLLHLMAKAFTLLADSSNAIATLFKLTVIL